MKSTPARPTRRLAIGPRRSDLSWHLVSPKPVPELRPDTLIWHTKPPLQHILRGQLPPDDMLSCMSDWCKKGNKIPESGRHTLSRPACRLRTFQVSPSNSNGSLPPRLRIDSTPFPLSKSLLGDFRGDWGHALLLPVDPGSYERTSDSACRRSAMRSSLSGHWCCPM